MAAGLSHVSGTIQTSVWFAMILWHFLLLKYYSLTCIRWTSPIPVVIDFVLYYDCNFSYWADTGRWGKWPNYIYCGIGYSFVFFFSWSFPTSLRLTETVGLRERCQQQSCRGDPLPCYRSIHTHRGSRLHQHDKPKPTGAAAANR